MDAKQNTIIGSYKNKKKVEAIAQMVFTICALAAMIAVISISVYILIGGVPAMFKVGLKEILFGSVWKPTAQEPQYGILYVILTSIVGTLFAILLGVPVGVFTAVFMAETAPKKVVAIVKPAVELLAGIPSVVYLYHADQQSADQTFKERRKGICIIRLFQFLRIQWVRQLILSMQEKREGFPISYCK